MVVKIFVSLHQLYNVPCRFVGVFQGLPTIITSLKNPCGINILRWHKLKSNPSRPDRRRLATLTEARKCLRTRCLPPKYNSRIWKKSAGWMLNM